ncbi:Ubiquitin-like protein ATG12, partial [Fragariocoptes setiger]
MTPPSTPSKSNEPRKIEILLKATGDAPIMNKRKWAIESYKKVSSVIEFIRKYISLGPSESLFIYVNQSFAPALDQTIENLYDCFESDGKLVLYYAKTQAWG